MNPAARQSADVLAELFELLGGELVLSRMLVSDSVQEIFESKQKVIKGLSVTVKSYSGPAHRYTLTSSMIVRASC